MKENLNVLTVIQETEILGRKITMYGSIEFPWFLAKDVAEWIDYSKSNGKYQVTNMLKKVDDDEKGLKTFKTLGGNQEAWFLTEDGLYESCMKSTKPIAKQIKKEIKSYLKQIRLTGGYVQSDREAEFIDNYFPTFSDETKRLMLADMQKENNAYKQKIAELEPKAKAYVDLMTAKGYLQFIDVSAMVETGRTKLFEFLREKKVLTKQSAFNIPYGRFAKNGMFKVVTSADDKGHISSVTMVSPSGLNYIYKLIKKNEMLDEFNTTALLSEVTV